MCGRFTHLFTWQQLHRLMRLVSPEVPLAMRYNVAPTQSAPVLLNDASLGGLALRMLQWGLVPSWAKDPSIGNSLINARAEGIATKPSFRNAFKRHRCLVPVSGFYEWQKLEGRNSKQPYYISARDSEPWLLAGLWESWSGGEGLLETFTIVTTEPNEPMARLHNRMPVILDPPAATRWTDPDADPSGLVDLLRPCPGDWINCWPVSTMVNSPRTDRAECIQTVTQQDFGGLFDRKS